MKAFYNTYGVSDTHDTNLLKVLQGHAQRLLEAFKSVFDCMLTLDMVNTSTESYPSHQPATSLGKWLVEQLASPSTSVSMKGNVQGLVLFLRHLENFSGTFFEQERVPGTKLTLVEEWRN